MGWICTQTYPQVLQRDCRVEGVWNRIFQGDHKIFHDIRPFAHMLCKGLESFPRYKPTATGRTYNNMIYQKEWYNRINSGLFNKHVFDIQLFKNNFRVICSIYHQKCIYTQKHADLQAWVNLIQPMNLTNYEDGKMAFTQFLTVQNDHPQI